MGEVSPVSMRVCYRGKSRQIGVENIYSTTALLRRLLCVAWNVCSIYNIYYRRENVNYNVFFHSSAYLVIGKTNCTVIWTAFWKRAEGLMFLPDQAENVGIYIMHMRRSDELSKKLDEAENQRDL